ncbi:hypothetical protein TcYC6_0101650 [Trypanosoma cruzi]|uniref:RING-type domain-containing protein n=1 Tax=Trypanosoma cruzi TaxID=5693 RepID=A0A7J6Y7F8_TRYCR|nr:hypothetical protein ECC02_004288 [Trypanosoma cruzi]KAF8294416.1 hypothetical protein TcYC6_0101650 [Trypanosoma cruzi]
MPFRPSCIICCSDCDTDGLFTSCQHFLCTRCTARYPPGQCPRCRKPCKAVKAGAALPKEVQERMAQDPQRLLTFATQTLEFQRRQEQQTLQRLREIVTTLNQSNRSMASQISAAKTERENLLNRIKRLQGQIYAQQQQQQQQMTQRTADSHIAGDNSGVTYGSGGQRMSSRAMPVFLQNGVVPSPNNAAICGWLSSPAVGSRATTPLGWSQSKRPRDDGHHTPNSSSSNNNNNNNNNHNSDDVSGAGSGELARFRLATPAITLRNALPGMRDAAPVHQMDCAAAMSAPKQLKSLLCRGP